MEKEFDMVIGIGIDIVELDRIKKAIESERFVERIFTLAERNYCYEKKQQAVASFAARFAAKEAMMKALNLGEKGAVWKEIEINRRIGERPEVFLTGVCKKVADELGVKNIFLSMSHNKQAAIAQIILTSN